MGRQVCFTAENAVADKIEELVKAKSRSRSKLINLMLTAVMEDPMFLKLALKEAK
jgi:hypothetical protein